MAERRVVVGSRIGLHARPAAVFVQAASKLGVPVRVTVPSGRSADATSLLGVLSLGAKNGDEIVLQADGDGAEAALDALVVVVEQDHDEAVTTA
jgi:phosphocarrier protein HPr